MFRNVKRLVMLPMCFSLVILLAVVVSPVHAHTTWWMDSGDSASDARSVWVYYSNEYDSNYNTDTKVMDAVEEMNSKKVDIIIASMTGQDIMNLSDPNAERTQRFQLLVNHAASLQMKVYVGHWEEQFDGSTVLMDKYTRVDHIINFNNQNGASDADIVGVVTDYEMHGSNRNAANYDKWREFHYNLKTRIGTNPLKVLPVTNDPDVWVANCTDCSNRWMKQNGISGSNPYSGDVAFFSTYNNVTFADALIGMYYYSTPTTIQTKAHDDIVEAQGLPTTIIVGFSVGPNGLDPSLLTEGEVNQTMDLIEQDRSSYPDGVLGAMGWRWDDPNDLDDEYRGTISSLTSYTYGVAEDAHVRGGAYADTNYGSSTIVEVKDAPGGTDYDRLGYFKFDYSGYPGTAVNTATLYFYLNSGVTDTTVSFVPMTIIGLPTDTWSESTLTWNNRPGSSGATTIGTIDVTGAGWYSLDATSYIQSEMTDKTATFRFSDNSITDRLVKMNSKENSNAPYLILQ